MLGKKRVGVVASISYYPKVTDLWKCWGRWGGFPIPYYPNVTDLWTYWGRRGWVRWLPHFIFLPYWGTYCLCSFILRIAGVNIWTSLGGVQSAQLTQSTSWPWPHFTQYVPNGICLCTKYFSFIVIIHLYTFSGWKLFQSIFNLHFSYFLTFLPLGVLFLCRSDLYKDHTS